MIRVGLLAIAAIISGALPAAAEKLNAKTARAFVADKLFAYQCFDGTTGVGRISNDGSVSGTIRVYGRDPTRFIRLPVNTVQENGEQICATVKGLPFSPCFVITKTSDTSFRGAVSGMGFMYCDFVRGGRPTVAKRPKRDAPPAAQ